MTLQWRPEHPVEAGCAGARLPQATCFAAHRGRAITLKGDALAKPNFQYQKRQKELEKKRKQEEKRQRKLERNQAAAPADPLAPPAAGEVPQE
jgi:hypothetical protein